MGSYTIGQAAERSGFRASTLRYYEAIGLVPPAARSAGGYRLYDDGTVARLAFIARAKQLGCSLEEITDLLVICSRDRCEPVQQRFRELVTDKLVTARRQVTEVAALTEQLEAAGAQLAGPAVDGPCDDGCACSTVAPPPPVATVVAAVDQTPPPVACTLDASTVPDRVAEWSAVLDGARSRLRTASGALRIELADDGRLPELARLVGAERRCCAFFTFAITVDQRGVALEVDAPRGADAAVSALFGSA